MVIFPPEVAQSHFGDIETLHGLLTSVLFPEKAWWAMHGILVCEVEAASIKLLSRF